MGLERLGSSDVWKKELLTLITSSEEKIRWARASKRTQLYKDDFYNLIKDAIAQVFEDGAVRNTLLHLAPFIGSSSFLKRISDEKARPVYSRTPTRRVLPDGEEIEIPDAGMGDDFETEVPPEQVAWNELCEEMDLDPKMDLVARLLEVHNDLWVFVRYVEELGMILDVVTPDMCSVLTDPDDDTRALAVLVVTKCVQGSPYEFTCWDDKQTFKLNVDGRISDVKPHQFGCIPGIDIHRRARWGCFWDSTTGNDVVACSEISMLYDLIVFKKIKAQSHLQLTYEGDLANLVKEQVTDEHSILVANGGSGTSKGFTVLDLQSDPEKIIKAKLDLQNSTAANHGISLDRMNQKSNDLGEDLALKERVTELAKVMGCAENRLFKLVKTMIRENPTYQGRLSDEDKLLVDFGQFNNRVDRTTQLAIRQAERSMGLRSGVDDVLEDNAEFGQDREKAKQYIELRMAEEAVIVLRRRALNIPADVVTQQPGEDPEFQGALGPAVRDGQMSRDKAANIATGGDVHTAGIPMSSEY